MRIRSIAVIILSALTIAFGQQTSNRTGSFDSLKANRDTLRFIDSARFYFSVRFDQKPRYWDAQVALFSNDTTSFRAFSDLKYLKNADSTAFRTFSDLKYLKNADSTAIRAFSDLKYLKNADSNSIRNYSNALYAPKGGGGSISDTNRFVMIDKSQSIYGLKIFLDSAEFGDAGNSAGYIRLQDGDSHVGRLRSADLSDDHIWYLPNASGTLALSSSIPVVISDTNRIVTVDKWQTIYERKQFRDTVMLGYPGGTTGILRFSDASVIAPNEGYHITLKPAFESLGADMEITVPSANGTILLNGDTTTFRTFSNIKYWSKADLDTSTLHYVKLSLKLNASDTVGFRAYSDLKYAPITSSGSVGDADSLGGIPAADYLTRTTTQNIESEKTIRADLNGTLLWSDGTNTTNLVRSGSAPVNNIVTLPAGTGTLIADYDTTTFRTRSDSLYAWTDKVNIFTAPNYFTARQYMTSLNVDTVVSRTANNAVLISDSMVVDNGLSVGRGNTVNSPNGGNFTVGKNNTVSSLGGTSVVFGELSSTADSYNLVSGLRNRASGTYSLVSGKSDTATGHYDYLFGDTLYTTSNNVFLSGTDLKANASYTTLWGANTTAILGTIGGFAYATSNDTIRFGHGTVSVGVPFIAGSVEGSAGITSSGLGLKSESQDTSSFWLQLYNGDPSTGTGTSTTALQLTKFKGELSNNYNRYNGNKFWVALRIDTSNNILWNDAKSSEFTYGDMKMTNGNFVVTAGSVDSDSIRDDGTTRATSGTWHSGIGAWSLGNITTGTINAGSNSVSGGYFDGDSLVMESAGDPLIRLVEAGNSGFRILYDGDGTNDLIIGAGTGGTFTPYFNMLRATGALTLSAPQTINSGLNTIVLTLSDVTTDATNKLARFGSKHYTNSEEPVAISFSNNTTSANTLNWGGGTGLMNSATVQNWYIGATNTTVTGTLTMILDAGRLTLGSTAGTGINDLVADDGSFAGKVVVEDSLRIDETGIPITKAVVDSNALEFTASSVEYRAMQTAYTKLYHDTTTAYSITLGTADSFYTVKNWNQSLGVRKNMTITDSSIIVRVAGYYQVQYSLSSASSSANTVLQTSIFQNFSRKSGTSAQQKIATANDIGNMTGLGIMYCNVGDYIQLRVRRSSGAGSCEVTEGQLVVTRID